MPTTPVAARGGLRSGRRQAEIEQDVRRQLARELHDRVAQTLTGMLVDVENFKSQEVGWEDVIKELDVVQSSTRQVLSTLRQLLHDLRGEDPVGGSLVDALAKLLNRFAEKTGISTYLDVRPGWPTSLNAPEALNVFRIVEEALTNVRMHSGARNVHVVLGPISDDQLELSVQDDGRGADRDSVAGLGTVGMRERAVLLGGRLWIESETGSGTRVHVAFPTAPVAPHQEPTLSPELLIQGA